MKDMFKRVMAALGATAVAIGGLAVGVGTANATDVVAPAGQFVRLAQNVKTNVSITGAPAALSGHTFKYVRIGTYTYAKTSDDSVDGDTKIAGLSVETDSDAVGYLNQVLSEVDANYADSIYYNTNPAGYIAEQMTDSGEDADPAWSGTLRNFVTELANHDTFRAAAGETQEVEALQGDEEVTVEQSVTQGLYVVTDVTANNGDEFYGNEGAYRASIPMVIGTKVVGYVDGTEQIEFDFEGQSLGTIQVKNDNPRVDKSITGIVDQTTNEDNGTVSDDGLSGTAQVGDVIEYELSATVVPNTAGYDTVKYPYVFRYIDTMDKGLTYNDDVSLYLDDNGDGYGAPNEQLRGIPASSAASADKASYDFTYEANPSGDTTVITIDLAKYVGGYSTDGKTLVEGSAAGLDSNRIGKEFIVKYTATLNNDAVISPDGSNDNRVRLEYSNTPHAYSYGKITPPDTQVYTGKFGVLKVDKTSNKTLEGATFQVSANGKQLKFIGGNGDYQLAKDQNAAIATADLVVGTDGYLYLSGVEGTYTIKETVPPTGYSNLFLPEFVVTVETKPLKRPALGGDKDDNKWYEPQNAVTTLKLDKQDIWGLVDKKLGTDSALVAAYVKVSNVTSVTELPKTGAAGIALFTVTGTLLAGFAVLVSVRARKTRNALRG